MMKLELPTEEHWIQGHGILASPFSWRPQVLKIRVPEFLRQDPRTLKVQRDGQLVQWKLLEGFLAFEIPAAEQKQWQFFTRWNHPTLGYFGDFLKPCADGKNMFSGTAYSSWNDIPHGNREIREILIEGSHHPHQLRHVAHDRHSLPSNWTSR